MPKAYSKFKFIWRPRFTLACLPLLIILVYLGSWQLERGEKKAALNHNLQQKILLEPVDFATIQHQDITQIRFTPVKIEGLYLNNYTVLLDNQMFQHQAGYKVLTPFQSPQLDKLVLVDRGWVAAGSNRQNMPTIEEVYGLQTVVGLINTISNGIVLDKNAAVTRHDQLLILQTLDYQLLEQQLQHPIYNYVIQVSDKTLTKYQITPVDFGVSPAKHMMYAVQWFLFAVLLAVYYVINSFKRT